VARSGVTAGRSRSILDSVEEGFERRLFLPDVRSPHRYLRVTWHKETSTVVLSHWQGEVCVASTPVTLDDATRLIGLIVGALKDDAVKPAETPAPPSLPRGLINRLRERIRPQLAEVVRIHDQRRHDGPKKRAGDA
jgi:hypothetical protein